MRMEIDKCNKCGKEFTLSTGRREVTCKHITFWEHDTKCYLCYKCYTKFQKYMEKHYNAFFTYLNKEEEK